MTLKSKIRSFGDWIFNANENLSWSMNFYPLYFSWPTQILHILFFFEKIEKLKYDDFEYFFYSKYILDIDFINNCIINNFKLILSTKMLNMKNNFCGIFLTTKYFKCVQENRLKNMAFHYNRPATALIISNTGPTCEKF